MINFPHQPWYTCRGKVNTKLIVYVDDGVESWKVEFPEVAALHIVPVLGFKPNTVYTLTVAVVDERGHEVQLEGGTGVVTDPLPDDFPVVDVKVSMSELMEPGFLMLDRITQRGDADPARFPYPAIFDANGNVVWYSTSGWFGSAMIKLENGNIAGDTTEVTLLGRLVKHVQHEEAGNFHHGAIRMPNGGYMGLVDELSQVENYPTSDTDIDAPRETADIFASAVVEIDAEGNLVNKWKLIDLLDPTRIGYGSLNFWGSGSAYDWGHSNAVIYDARDDSIIVSVRHQDAIIKFSRATGQLIWILGTHDNWSSEYQPYLLSPVGDPFDWQWHPHAPMITESGTLMLFDNGNFKASPFDGRTRVANPDNYSRAVEYLIDEDAMEVRQVWEYGKSSASRTYASFIGDADAMPQTRNTIVHFGGTQFIDGVSAADLGLGSVLTRVTEVTHDTPATVVFDMIIYNPAPGQRVQTYRSEKIASLYASDVVITPSER